MINVLAPYLFVVSIFDRGAILFNWLMLDLLVLNDTRYSLQFICVFGQMLTHVFYRR